jgi:hypothetical protein
MLQGPQGINWIVSVQFESIPSAAIVAEVMPSKLGTLRRGDIIETTAHRIVMDPGDKGVDFA